jgi:hypothetical protein
LPVLANDEDCANWIQGRRPIQIGQQEALFELFNLFSGHDAQITVFPKFPGNRVAIHL